MGFEIKAKEPTWKGDQESYTIIMGGKPLTPDAVVEIIKSYQDMAAKSMSEIVMDMSEKYDKKYKEETEKLIADLVSNQFGGLRRNVGEE